MNTLYRILADFVVTLHLTYVLFVLVGLLLILLGIPMKWKWVRNFWFRVTHLTMIGIVVVEALLSITCPLTTLENYLRTQAGESVRSGSFIGKLAHDLLFYQLPPNFFTPLYCAFGAAVVLAFALAPPRMPKRLVKLFYHRGKTDIQ